ncbi:MAG: serine/threonine protein kinase [Myxococcales bacterium]|nr:serine/threonine protein kinase [Myxococcales bacterium]
MKLCPKCQKQFSSDANFCPVDAARLIPLEGQAVGADPLAARFELGDRLGGARTGTVFRAKDKTTGAAVAVKVVAPEVTALPGVAQRLERELKQLERVQSSGVAKIVASGKRPGLAGDETWVAIELLDGAQTLAEAISARGPIGLDFAAHLIEVIGEALIEAAQVGVVHRDLAPKNILFASSGSGSIKLINFSLPVPTTEKVPGVPEFVAPEQVDGKAVDQRSNLYSLGALYYYVLTGVTVHTGATDEVHRAHVNGSIKTPSSLAAVPAPVEAVIMRALDRSPTKRFLTVRQFVDEVGRVARGEADPKSTQSMGKAGRPKAELVQTLMGVARNGGTIPLGSGIHGEAPAFSAPVAAAKPSAAALSADRSPWAPPASEPPAPGIAAIAAPVVPAPVVAAPVVAAPVVAAPVVAAPVVAAPVVAAPVVAAPVVAAPVVAAPVVAAPVLAAPVVAAAPAGKKKAPEEAGSKGKFRETMWFKKGDLDAQAAVTAAEERERTGKDGAADKADSMPIDERYKDDGSISRGDKEKYSLRTGATQMMSAVQDPKQKTAGDSTTKVSEDALIGEMKGGRNKIFLFIGIAVVVVIGIVVLLVR